MNYTLSPRNQHFIPRKLHQKTGEIVLRGNADLAHVKKIKYYLYKDEKLVSKTEVNLLTDTFETKIPVEAGQFLYTLKSFEYASTGDSLLISTIVNIVCGDLILIYGQSNAEAYLDEEYFWGYNAKGQPRVSDTYNRTLGYDDIEIYPIKSFKNKVGGIGFTLASLIEENHKIPVCIANFSVGAKNLLELTEINIYNSIYAPMIWRLEKFHLKDYVHMIVFRQGEQDQVDIQLAANYQKNFDVLYKQFKKDFPNLQKIYLFQNNVNIYAADEAWKLYEFQRNADKVYPDIQPISSLGISTWGNSFNHYQSAGYEEAGKLIYRLAKRDLYRDYSSYEKSPNLQKLIYEPKNNRIRLLFDQDMGSIVDSLSPQGFVNQDRFWTRNIMKVDGKPIKVKGYQNIGPNMYLNLSEPLQNPQKLSYLPVRFDNYDYVEFVYPSVFRSTAGVSAFNFLHVPIQLPLDVPKINYKVDHDKAYISNLVPSNSYQTLYILKNNQWQILGNLTPDKNQIERSFEAQESQIVLKTQAFSDSSESVLSEETTIVRPAKIEPEKPVVLGFNSSYCEGCLQISVDQGEILEVKVFTEKGTEVAFETHEIVPGKVSIKLLDQEVRRFVIIFVETCIGKYSKKIFIE